MTHVSGSRLMLYFRIVWLMYPVSVITYVLNILDTFNTGVTLTLCFALTINKSQGQSLESIFPNRFLLMNNCTSLCRESLPKRDWKCLYWMKKIACVLRPPMLCTVMFFRTFNRSFLMMQVSMSFFSLLNFVVIYIFYLDMNWLLLLAAILIVA